MCVCVRVCVRVSVPNCKINVIRPTVVELQMSLRKVFSRDTIPITVLPKFSLLLKMYPEFLWLMFPVCVVDPVLVILLRSGSSFDGQGLTLSRPQYKLLVTLEAISTPLARCHTDTIAAV